MIFPSGYNIRPTERDYSCANTGQRCDTFCETIIRKRFLEIKSFPHAAENQSLSESRMAKVEPLHLFFVNYFHFTLH